MKYDIVIVGGGAAGLFMGMLFNKTNLKIAILEKNQTCGKKLLLSGSGKCNITQSGDINDFFNHYGANSRFLKHSLFSFTNNDLINLLKLKKIETEILDNGKIFPKSESAKEILNLFINECKKNKIDIITNTTVIKINYNDNTFYLTTNNKSFSCEKLIIATGGITYPITGSNGDGQRFAKEFGHKVIPMKPALTPVIVKNYDLSDLSGQSFNVSYSLWRNNKKIHTYHGDILLTHKGLSGPGILNNSRDMNKKDLIKINFINENIETFKIDFVNLISNNGKMLVKSLIRKLDIPKKLADKICELANVDDKLKNSELTKDKRLLLINLLTEFCFEIKELGNINIAMVTSGGVSLKEINPKTMQSRKINNLYFIGEVLDIDGDTGGYNLQAAFSTAYVATNAILSNK